jgi:cephalosporin-C deacetylase-like acetyl esterase
LQVARAQHAFLAGQIKDALAAVDFLQTEKAVDASRLSLVGWSMGGAVASAVAGRSTHPICAVALWAPLTNPPMTFSGFLGADYMASGLNSGDTVVTTKTPWGKEIALKAGFFEDLFRIDPIAELARFRGPVFVAAGSNDEVIKPQPAMSRTLLTYHLDPGELWVRSMDHSFNAFRTSATVDELIAATLQFIQKNDNHPPDAAIHR